jgi:hypothetical protein
MLCNLDFLIVATSSPLVIGMVDIIYVTSILVNHPPIFFLLSFKEPTWCPQSLICRHYM